MEKNNNNNTKSIYFTRRILCITLKERNRKQFVQNWHSLRSPSTEWSCIFLIEFVIFYLFAMQFDYCNIQSSKVGIPNCFCSHKLCFNASKLYQKWKKLVNVPVCHIYNVFKLRVTFSTFPS